jgi:hypothetical protein
LVAGKSAVSLKAISLLDDGRAVCTLTTVDAQLVGMYAVADERIVAGCHYFSDLDLLSRIGTLPPHHTAQRAPRREEAGDGSGPATLGDVLLEGRLAHRHERLRLVIHALDERLAALTASERVVPAALLAAIQGFQKELAHVRGELHALRRPSHQRPPDNRGKHHEYRRRTPAHHGAYRHRPDPAPPRSERPCARADDALHALWTHLPSSHDPTRPDAPIRRVLPTLRRPASNSS